MRQSSATEAGFPFQRINTKIEDMNQSPFGVVLTLILALAGFAQNQPVVWALAIATAALAFLKIEADLVHDATGKRPLRWAAIMFGVASGGTTATAAALLII